MDLQQRNPANNFPDPVQTNWGTLQLEFEDPFGNLLRFNEIISA